MRCLYIKCEDLWVEYVNILQPTNKNVETELFRNERMLLVKQL